MARDHDSMPQSYEYDVLIIGSGDAEEVNKCDGNSEGCGNLLLVSAP